MDNEIRKTQNIVLEAFSQKRTNFALCGGTALELYYLHHRFSFDLDFFSPDYNVKEIAELALVFGRAAKKKAKFESEFVSSSHARVKFYTIDVKNSDRPLKIDFVEDVIFKNPSIMNFKGVRVYDVERIYFQKICAITGTSLREDETGREITQGRNEARDAFDLYMLSKKIKPLHLFLKEIPAQQQRGIIHWYRSFSRQDLKLTLLELDIYDKKFDARDMIICLENEIKTFAREAIE